MSPCNPFSHSHSPQLASRLEPWTSHPSLHKWQQHPQNHTFILFPRRTDLSQCHHAALFRILILPSLPIGQGLEQSLPSLSVSKCFLQHWTLSLFHIFACDRVHLVIRPWTLSRNALLDASVTYITRPRDASFTSHPETNSHCQQISLRVPSVIITPLHNLVSFWRFSFFRQKLFHLFFEAFDWGCSASLRKRIPQGAKSWYRWSFDNLALRVLVNWYLAFNCTSPSPHKLFKIRNCLIHPCFVHHC